MPTVFSAHKVLKGYRVGFNNMEDAIFGSLCSKRRKKCTIDPRLQVTPDMGNIEFGRMTEAIVNGGYDITFTSAPPNTVPINVIHTVS